MTTLLSFLLRKWGQKKLNVSENINSWNTRSRSRNVLKELNAFILKVLKKHKNGRKDVSKNIQEKNELILYCDAWKHSHHWFWPNCHWFVTCSQFYTNNTKMTSNNLKLNNQRHKKKEIRNSGVIKKALKTGIWVNIVYLLLPL